MIYSPCSQTGEATAMGSLHTTARDGPRSPQRQRPRAATKAQHSPSPCKENQSCDVLAPKVPQNCPLSSAHKVPRDLAMIYSVSSLLAQLKPQLPGCNSNAPVATARSRKHIHSEGCSLLHRRAQGKISF